MKTKKITLLLILTIFLIFSIFPYNTTASFGTFQMETIFDCENINSQQNIETIWDNVLSDSIDGGTILDITTTYPYEETKTLRCRSSHFSSEPYTKAYLNLTETYDYIQHINITLFSGEHGSNDGWERDFIISFNNDGTTMMQVALSADTDQIDYRANGGAWTKIGDYSRLTGVANELDGYWNINLTHISGNSFNYSVYNKTQLLNYTTGSTFSALSWSTFDSIHLDGRETNNAGAGDNLEVWIDKIEICYTNLNTDSYNYIGWINFEDSSFSLENPVTFQCSEYNNTEFEYNIPKTWILKEFWLPVHELHYNAYNMGINSIKLKLNGNELGTATKIDLYACGDSTGLRKHIYKWTDINKQIDNVNPNVELTYRDGTYMPLINGIEGQDIDGDGDILYHIHDDLYSERDGYISGTDMTFDEPQFRLYYHSIQESETDSIEFIGLNSDNQLKQWSSLGIKYSINRTESIPSYINISRAGFSKTDTSSGQTTFESRGNNTGMYYATINRGNIEKVNESFELIFHDGRYSIWFYPKIINEQEPVTCKYRYNTNYSGYNGEIYIYNPHNEIIHNYLLNTSTDNEYHIQIPSNQHIIHGYHNGYLYTSISGDLIDRDNDNYFVDLGFDTSQAFIDTENEKYNFTVNKTISIHGNHFWQGDDYKVRITRNGKQIQKDIDCRDISYDSYFKLKYTPEYTGTYIFYLYIDNIVADNLKISVTKPVTQSTTHPDFKLILAICFSIFLGSLLALKVAVILFPVGFVTSMFIFSLPVMGAYQFVDEATGLAIIGVIVLIMIILWLMGIIK